MANIYVIDDDVQLLNMVGMMLERGGHDPTLMSDPVEGLERIKASRPDLLVVDVMMPRMSGHDVCRNIRADSNISDLPILVLTARAQDIDRSTALKSGANDYLSKPVTAQQLNDRVADLLSAHEESGSSQPMATVIALFSLRGGVGRTTLATNLAAALRRRSQQEVVLVDLTPSGGQAALHLRLKPSRGWQDLPVGGELNWEILSKRTLVHDSGLRLLAAPPLPLTPDQPPPQLVNNILKALVPSVRFVVFDLPSTLSDGVSTVLQNADLVLHTITPDVISAQIALQSNRVIMELKPAIKQKVYVLNQTTPDAQLPVAAIESGLKTRIVFQVDYDKNQSRALAQGAPLALSATASSIPLMISRLAEAIVKKATKS